MKKIALILFVVVSLLNFNNCSDEIEFNNPSIQGNKDGVFWKAEYERVDIDNSGWLIEGGNYVETLQLVTNSDHRGTFNLGPDSPNIAIFRDAEGTIYSTANEPHPDLSVYPAEGVIKIYDISHNTPKEVFGNFWFTAYSSDGMKSINFNQGIVYNAPITDGLEQITD